MGAGALTDTDTSYESELAERCKKENPIDEGAWSDLWNRYNRLTLWRIRRVLPQQDEGTAEELVSETYRKLLNSIQGYDPNRGRLSTFVLQVATSTALDFQRKARRRIQEEKPQEAELPILSASPAETLPLEVAARRLREEVTAPEDATERLVFEELFRGMSAAEIARKHQLSEKLVKRVRRETLSAALGVLQDLFPEM